MDKKLPHIQDVHDVQGKRVLVRASLNVPVRDGIVADVFRLKSIVPTVNYLRERGARVILLGHIGREKTETLRPVCVALQKEFPVQWAGGTLGGVVEEQIGALENGQVLLLENVRAFDEETTNDEDFARDLASLADIYVNDAFADSHRSHASVVGIPQHIPSYFGFAFHTEYQALSRALLPEHPSLFILGGAKFETKQPLVEQFAKLYDHVFIAGALMNDLFKAKGYEVGTSLTSGTSLVHNPVMQIENILLPVDVSVQRGAEVHVTTPDKVRAHEAMMDIGPQTLAMLVPYIKNAKTILWNGPLGAYELGFDKFTKKCAALVAESHAVSIVGGGDTVAAIQSLGITKNITHVSTAGGAMLTFLETGTLPAIDAVLYKV